MKLTKGKISKIYNKKRQTMRKFKIKGKKRSYRRKTFRKRRHLNLSNKTLKKYDKKQDNSMSQMYGGHSSTPYWKPTWKPGWKPEDDEPEYKAEWEKAYRLVQINKKTSDQEAELNLLKEKLVTWENNHISMGTHTKKIIELINDKISKKVDEELKAERAKNPGVFTRITQNLFGKRSSPSSVPEIIDAEVVKRNAEQIESESSTSVKEVESAVDIHARETQKLLEKAKEEEEEEEEEPSKI
jgi:hypothetical protein